MTDPIRRVAIDLGSSNAALVEEQGGDARAPARISHRSIPVSASEPAASVLHRLLGADEGGTDERGAYPQIDELLLVHPLSWDAPRVAELLRAAEGARTGSTRAVPHPIAVAGFYAEDGAPSPGSCAAVVDLGASSCAVTLLHAEAGGSFEPILHRSLAEPDGAILDRLVIGWIEQRLRERGEDELLELLEDPTAEALRSRVKQRAREAKEALSEMPNASLLIDSDRRSVALEITRAEFEECTAAVFEPVTSALHEVAGEAPGGLSAVYLSGGGARLPALASVVQRATGLLPARIDRPEFVAAAGALRVPAAPADAPSATGAIEFGPRDETARRVSDEIVRLANLAEALLGEAAAPTAAELREDAGRVARIAVVGRVKSGKSTLVNAVIGRRVAPTDDRECTLVTTRYQYGAPERCEVRLLSGETRSMPLEDGALPRDLGGDIAEIEYTTVYLSCDALRDFTLVDTPGLASTTAQASEANKRYLFGERQTENADAILYAFRHAQFADDSAALRALTASRGAIGVLSFADVHTSPWGEADPLEAAAADAAEIAARTPELATVIPLAGRLAEAAKAGLIRETDAAALAGYADADEIDLELGAAGDAGELERLSDLLGEYGLRHGRAVAAGGAAELRRWAHATSNIDALSRELAARSVNRYHHLIAHSSLQRLEKLARQSGSMQALSAIQEARQLPHMHGVVEIEAAMRLTANHPEHPLLSELALQLDARNDRERAGAPAGAGPEQIRALALAAGSRARARASVSFDPAEEFALRTLTRSYALIASRSTAG